MILFFGSPDPLQLPPPPPPAPLPGESQARLDELAAQREALRKRRLAREDFVRPGNAPQAGLNIP